MGNTFSNKSDQLNKDIPIPLYFQLKEKIKEKIVNGSLEPGDLIPSERELSKKYNISRPTIRQALKGLVNEGLLYREKGRGTFVSNPKIKYGFIQKFTTFYDDMKEKGYETETKVIKQEIQYASGSLAKKLEISENDKIIFIHRIRYIKGDPIVSVINNIPYRLCTALIDENLENKSLYRTLADNYNIKPHKAEITLEPIVANEYDTELLNIDENQPMFLMKNLTYSTDDVAIDYFESHFRGDKGKVKVELHNNID